MPDWIKEAFGRSFWMFAAFAAITGAACYVIAGAAATRASIDGDLKLLLDLLPRLGAAVLVAGFIQVLLPRDLVGRWLGAQSGHLGLIVATIAGTVTPGGPMTAFPLVTALYVAGAERGALVAYVTSWSLLGLQRIFVWELPLMGPKFTLIRFMVSLPLGYIAGLIARKLPIAIEPRGAARD